MTATSPYVNVAASGWVVLLSGSLLALACSNPWLTLMALWTIPVLVTLLWRRNEPPVLLFAVMVQWAEASTKVFHANMLDVSVAELFGDAVIVESIIRGLVGLITLAIGMRLALTGLESRGSRELWREGMTISIVRAWQLYAGAFLFSLTVQGVVWIVPEFAQILLPIFNLKWVFFYLFAYAVFVQRKHYDLLLLVVAVEVVIGFSGFFSGFKQVFFVLVVTYLALSERMSGRRIIVLSAIGGLVVALAVVWMAIREDYRYFMNAGTGAQVVKRTMESRLSKLTDLISKAETREYLKGAERLAERIAYVDMFAYVLKRVPASIPHENGRLWGRAVRHVLTPRFLFPEKAKLKSDSELSMLYTGLVLASGDQGTSISMGYMAESYIDFGSVAMYVPILLLGFLWGGMYRYFVNRGPPKIIGYGVAVAVLINANQFEMHSTKLIGSMLMSFFVMALITKLVLPYLQTWILDSAALSLEGASSTGAR